MSVARSVITRLLVRFGSSSGDDIADHLKHAGATWAEVNVTAAGSYETPKMFMFRATQLLPQRRYGDGEAGAVVSHQISL